MRNKTLICLTLCCPLLALPACSQVVYMPVEPAYDKEGKLRTDGYFVKTSYLVKLNEDLKACSK